MQQRYDTKNTFQRFENLANDIHFFIIYAGSQVELNDRLDEFYLSWFPR